VKVEQPNGFIEEYELPRPITVFGGYKTKRVALAGSGILAVLDGQKVTTKGLAETLKLEPAERATSSTPGSLNAKLTAWPKRSFASTPRRSRHTPGRCSSGASTKSR
jgi:hypothetical protein